MHNSVHFLIDKYDKLAVITFHRNIIRYYFERDNIKFENENKENFNELRKKGIARVSFLPFEKNVPWNLRTAIFEFGWEIVTKGRRRWILFYSQHGGAAGFGIFRVEYVSYHHRGVTRHLLPIHNASSRCGSHFEYILAQGELSPKRFDFPFKGSYIYTCRGEGDEVSIEEPARGWWCLKILAACHHPDALPLSAHPLLLVETYIYIHTSLTSEGNRIPLSCCSHTFVYPA